MSTLSTLKTRSCQGFSGDVLSVPGAARLAGVSPSSILRAISRGLLPAFRPMGESGHYRIRREAVERWISRSEAALRAEVEGRRRGSESGCAQGLSQTPKETR